MNAEALNSVARARRSKLPATNAFTVKELLGQPPLFDWVKCSSGHSQFSMFLGGNDDGVALRFLWNGGYEATTLKAWTWLARSAKVVIDIGAHTGAYTLSALAANPALRAIAFEPYFMNFARLRLNLRGNGFDPSAAFMMAVGSKTEVVPFSVSSGSDYLSSGGSVGKRDNASVSSVQAVALDAFLVPDIKAQVSAIKIDAEGFEPHCIAGMRGVLAASHPTIFFECMDDRSTEATDSALRDLGYRFFEVDDAAGTISPVTKLTVHRDAAGQPILSRLNRIALAEGTITAEQIA